jgi:hypothetical protein
MKWGDFFGESRASDGMIARAGTPLAPRKEEAYERFACDRTSQRAGSLDPLANPPIDAVPLATYASAISALRGARPR